MEKYMEIMQIGNRSDLILVTDLVSGELFVLRSIDISQLEVYTTLKNIKCDNIPNIVDIIQCENNTYKIIEEFIEGKTLDDLMKDNTLFSENEAIFYICQLCDILAQIHSKGLIHRDIKPSNIIITDENKLYLIDFDISRTYKDNKNVDTAFLGTKGYAAPEQFGFSQTDVRTDIYAVGVLLNQLLTGKLPLEQMSKSPIKKIISKCIDIDPNHRYQSAKKLKISLNMYSPSDYNLVSRIFKQIPGFRTHRAWKMILSSIFYLFILLLFLIAMVDPLSGIVFILSLSPFIFLILYAVDFRDLRQKNSWINKSKSKLGYVIRCILFGFLLFIVTFFCITVICVILIIAFG